MITMVLQLKSTSKSSLITRITIARIVFANKTTFLPMISSSPPPLVPQEITQVSGGNELWPLERPDGMPSITSLEVMCGKDHMDVHLSFSQPFEGIVSSKGQHSDQRCIYVQPSSKKTFYTFRIAYSRCGTKPDLNGQFYENTVRELFFFFTIP